MSVFNFTIFAKGGPMMWVLLALGLLTVLLALERVLFLHRGQIRATTFLEGIKNILAKRRLVPPDTQSQSYVSHLKNTNREH